MKKYSILIAALCLATSLAAQNQSAYFMEGTTFRSQLNPAFAPLRGYVNIPVAGGIHLTTNGNLSLDNLLFPRNGQLVTLIDSSVSAADALANLKTDNLLGVDARINLIGFGAFARNQLDFWSFDLNVRTTSDVNLPYSLFDFLKRGHDGQIRDIGMMANSYLEAAFAYSFPLLDNRLYIGLRAKMLFGMARARLNYDRFDVSLNDDRWLVDASGVLDVTAAGAQIKTSSAEGTYKPNDMQIKPTKPAGYGFGVDLGATYDILPQLQASLSVNDLGFIGWSQKSNLSGRSVKQLEFTGVEVDADGTATQPDFDLDMLEFTPDKAVSHSKMLRASLNAGIEYEVWRHKIGLGLLYTARFWEYQTLHNLTGSVNFHPIRWFTLTGSYSVIGNRGNAVGLALNLCPNWINFFVATDMLIAKHTPQWLPISHTTMNLTLGIGVPIGKRSRRIAAYTDDQEIR